MTVASSLSVAIELRASSSQQKTTTSTTSTTIERIINGTKYINKKKPGSSNYTRNRYDGGGGGENSMDDSIQQRIKLPRGYIKKIIVNRTGQARARCSANQQSHQYEELLINQQVIITNSYFTQSKSQ